MRIEKDQIKIRKSVQEDAKHLKEWLMEPGILRWFPMSTPQEVDESIKVWMDHAKIGAALTADFNGSPAGAGVIYVSSFVKFAHQALFAIVVDKELRGRGIGQYLIEQMMELAKNFFKIRLLHLEVYEGNPAFSLYKRMGFVEYGRHENFLKEPTCYRTKILMQKRLV